MPEWPDDVLQAWRSVRGEEPPPGSPEPIEGKCGARLSNKGLREMEDLLGIAWGAAPARYCKRPAGARTDHGGLGPCNSHLGDTPNVNKKYMPIALHQDLMTLADLWDEPLGLDPAPVEAERLFLKFKKMFYALEVLVLEMGTLDIFDIHGRNQAKAVFEMYERAGDRLMSFTQFALKHDLAQKRVALLQKQAQDIAGAVMSVVMDPRLQLTPDQLAMIRENLGRVLVDLSPNFEPAWAKDFIDAEEEE